MARPVKQEAVKAVGYDALRHGTSAMLDRLRDAGLVELAGPIEYELRNPSGRQKRMVANGFRPTEKGRAAWIGSIK